MKNMQLSLCLLFVGSALYGMDKQQVIPWKDIDCHPIEQALEGDYKLHICNRLEEYKKTDFTPVDMDAMVSMADVFTGKRFLDGVLGCVSDKSSNTFTHIAAGKADVPIMRWLGHRVSYHTNNEGKEPIDLCIEQLLPGAAETNRAAAHEVLDVLTAAYDKHYKFCMSSRKKFLCKMVALQLEHKKSGTGLVLKDVLFTRFLTECGTGKEPLILSDIYQEVMDQSKNTFTHIAVQQHMPDELYELIKKEYVTFAKNGEEKTPVDLACEAFRTFTQNSQLIEVNKDEFSKTRCCLFMLLNYLRVKNIKKVSLQCCDKHTI